MACKLLDTFYKKRAGARRIVRVVVYQPNRIKDDTMTEPSENHPQSVSPESLDYGFGSGQLAFGFLGSDKRKRPSGRKPRLSPRLPGKEKTPNAKVAVTSAHPPTWNLTTKPTKRFSNEDIASAIELIYLSVTSGNGDLFRTRAYSDASSPWPRTGLP